MEDRTTRVVIGLLAMVGLWVGVYWWWPVDPPVSFAVVAQTPLPEGGAGGGRETLANAQQVPTPQSTTQDSPTPNPSLREGLEGVVKPRFATHVVGKDETLESISLMYFGTRAKADAIARANPMLSPPDLKPGREILVPLDPANVQGNPVGESVIASSRAQPPAGLTQEYMVQAGDSLAKIAKQIYGSEQFADIIFAANRDKLSEPSRIKVGQRLRIPPKPAEKLNADDKSEGGR
jgi:nucleoid-associated protein YgaU